MDTAVQQAIDSFAPITLDEVQSRASLLTRVDNKYIVDWRACAGVLETLLDDFRVLEIAARRTFEYETAYFDTHSLTLYRAHVQRRRKRFKCRSRHYVNSGIHFFEMKMKGRRNETIKRQMAYDKADVGVVTADAWQFVRECLIEQYGQQFDDELALALRNHYHRMTLVAREGIERMTCDFDLSFDDPTGSSGRLSSDFLILETKTMRGTGVADRTLKAIGARPLGCSKYCIGTALLRPDVKSNNLRGVLKSYFESNSTTTTVPRYPPAERPRTSATSSGAVERAEQTSTIELHRLRRRISLIVTSRLSLAAVLVGANAASAYELCTLTNPSLWLALVAGISFARVESEIIARLHHRRRIGVLTASDLLYESPPIS